MHQHVTGTAPHFHVNDLTSIAQIKDHLENRFGEADIQFMDEITHLHLGGKLETKLKHGINLKHPLI